MSGSDGRGSILFVCTANICRSPYAHLRAEDALAEMGVSDIDISSAGISAVPGHPVADDMIDILASRDVDASAWRSRRLAPADALDADLILTATREHRAGVVRAAPGALKRTFTLLQFQRLLSTASIDDPTSSDGVGAVTKLVQAAITARGRTVAGADDVEDPWQRPRQEYLDAAAIIDSAVGDLAGMLSRIRRR